MTSSASGFGGMAASSGSGSTTGNASTSSSTTSSSTDASSSSSDASSSVAASSSSGGATDIPFCDTTGGSQADNFDAYGSDAMFNAMGQGNGPWAEFGGGAGDVSWTSGDIRTQSPPGFLFRKTAVTMPTGGTPQCAITVKLVSLTSGNALFGLRGTMTAADPNATSIVVSESSGNYSVNAFGFSGPASITLPTTFALVARPSNILGFYLEGATWIPLQAQTSGVSVSWFQTSQAQIRFGQRDGGGSSHWDDYDVVPLPSSVAP
ncbi:MAG: hypothetical protein U0414_24290 [Polyangiaceae bacterium]